MITGQVAPAILKPAQLAPPAPPLRPSRRATQPYKMSGALPPEVTLKPLAVLRSVEQLANKAPPEPVPVPVDPPMVKTEVPFHSARQPINCELAAPPMKKPPCVAPPQARASRSIHVESVIFSVKPYDPVAFATMRNPRCEYEVPLPFAMLLMPWPPTAVI